VDKLQACSALRPSADTADKPFETKGVVAQASGTRGGSNKFLESNFPGFSLGRKKFEHGFASLPSVAPFLMDA